MFFFAPLCLQPESQALGLGAFRAGKQPRPNPPFGMLLENLLRASRAQPSQLQVGIYCLTQAEKLEFAVK